MQLALRSLRRLSRRLTLASVPFSFSLSENENGEGEIRTHGGVAPTTVFKTAAFNHSATSPRIIMKPISGYEQFFPPAAGLRSLTCLPLGRHSLRDTAAFPAFLNHFGGRDPVTYFS